MTAPAIITICGSMRFFDQMLKVAAEETVKGNIVLAPFSTVAQPDQGSDMKQRLDELHFRKIDLSERIIVVTNQDGYVGESTCREMAYALNGGKLMNVREFETDPVIVDGHRVVGSGHRVAP